MEIQNKITTSLKNWKIKNGKIFFKEVWCKKKLRKKMYFFN